nr:MAG TPA: hypothetical protein [Caudoviricetes sp.]
MVLRYKSGMYGYPKHGKVYGCKAVLLELNVPVRFREVALALSLIL